MTSQSYNVTAERLLNLAKQIAESKRPAYTQGSEDVLANFKRIAERVHSTPGTVLLVYLHKHLDAIAAALTDPKIQQSESIEGRFADAINYLLLGYALVLDEYSVQVSALAGVNLSTINRAAVEDIHLVDLEAAARCHLEEQE